MRKEFTPSRLAAAWEIASHRTTSKRLSRRRSRVGSTSSGDSMVTISIGRPMSSQSCRALFVMLAKATMAVGAATSSDSFRAQRTS